MTDYQKLAEANYNAIVEASKPKTIDWQDESIPTVFRNMMYVHDADKATLDKAIARAVDKVMSRWRGEDAQP